MNANDDSADRTRFTLKLHLRYRTASGAGVARFGTEVTGANEKIDI